MMKFTTEQIDMALFSKWTFWLLSLTLIFMIKSSQNVGKYSKVAACNVLLSLNDLIDEIVSNLIIFNFG